MKRSLKESSVFKIMTKDGKEGSVEDILFDETQWIVRYLETDFGSLFSSRRILIPRVFLKVYDWENKLFHTEITEAEIKNCPKPEDQLPISRKYEEALHEYYKFDPYWPVGYIGTPRSFHLPRPAEIPTATIEEDKLGTVLRSFKEVEGYHIRAADGKIGHIEDLIVDDENWRIVYSVVDTSNWLPWSKKVLIAINFISEISYVAREVKIKLNTGTIKNAPEYDPADFMDEHFENGLHDFYSRSLVK